MLFRLVTTRTIVSPFAKPSKKIHHSLNHSKNGKVFENVVSQEIKLNKRSDFARIKSVLIARSTFFLGWFEGRTKGKISFMNDGGTTRKKSLFNLKFMEQQYFLHYSQTSLFLW